MEGCLPQDGAGNFIADRERSDVVHDSAGFSRRADAGDGQGEASLEIRGFLGWLEG
ncbi:MAG: hypothetical protein ACP5OU_00650 [Methanothrix sp.]